jgi:hypothetical protein
MTQDALNACPDLVEKIRAKSGLLGLVVFGSLGEFAQRRGEKAMRHFANLRRSSAIPAGPSVAVISPRSNAVIRSSDSRAHAASVSG